MKRDKIEAIVKSLDTGTLLQMLATQGIHIAEAAEQSPEQPDEGNTQAWDKIRVELEGRGQREPIHSPERYLKPKTEMIERPEYIAAENPPALEPWFNAGMAGGGY